MGRLKVRKEPVFLFQKSRSKVKKITFFFEKEDQPTSIDQIYILAIKFLKVV